MPSSLEELKSASSTLSQRDRTELAQFLLDSLDPVDGEQWKIAWSEELAQRLEEFESGKVVGIPAETVLTRLRERYP